MSKKETKELRGLSKEKLLKEKNKAEESIIYCHKGTSPKFPPQKNKNLKIRLARINTLLKEK